MTLDAAGRWSIRINAQWRIPRTRIERIVRAETAISADTALRLGRYFGVTPQFWMNLQTRYDLETAQRGLKRGLGRIAPRPGLAKTDAAE